ncbi:MAG: OmpP1/FadL family transporter [Candidatus Latescibacterota bacterium]
MSFRSSISGVIGVMVFAAGCFFLSSSSSAQEMVVGNDAGVGARAMGMGGAYTAVSDDASAIYYNPAGLAQVRRFEWNLGLSVLQAKEKTFLRSNLSTPALGTESANKTVSSISSFGGVFPLPTYRGSLVFAASYNRVKEFDSDFKVAGYSDSWDGNIQGRSSDSGGLDMWSFAGAVDVSPNVSLGASLDFYRGSHTLDEKRVYRSGDPVYSEMFHTGYTDNIRAWNLHGGMLVRTSRNLRLGASIKLPITYHYKTSYFDDWYARSGRAFSLAEHGSHASSDTSEAYDGKFSYYVKSPIQMNLGLSWMYRGLTLSGDVTLLDWSQSETDLAEPEYLYRNTMSWRVGAEVPLPAFPGFLRAGYASAPDPYEGYVHRTDTVGVAERNKRDFLTLGLGVLLDPSVMLDVALIHGFWSGEEAPRTDESTRNKVFVTFSYRM